MKKKNAAGSRSAAFLSTESLTGERQVLQVLHGEDDGFACESFAGVRRVGRLKSARTQVTAGKGAEACREGFGKTVAAGRGFLVAQAAGCARYADEHESAFHKTALGAESACAVHARGGVQRLLLKGNAKVLTEAEKHGFGAVAVLFPVKLVYSGLQSFMPESFSRCEVQDSMAEFPSCACGTSLNYSSSVCRKGAVERFSSR